MGLDIVIALLIIGAVVLGVYLITHHKPPVVPSPGALASTLSAGIQESWATVKEDLPGLVSARVAELEAALAVALKRAADAEVRVAAEQAARAASLEAVKTQVGAVIATIGAAPVTAQAAPVAPNPTQGV